MKNYAQSILMVSAVLSFATSCYMLYEGSSVIGLCQFFYGFLCVFAGSLIGGTAEEAPDGYKDD